MPNLRSLCVLAFLFFAIPSSDIAQSNKAFSRVTVEGVELEYEVRGKGEPVVLIHAGVFADWFKPLMKESALTNHYRVVNYHRVGYAGSSRIPGPVSIAQQAAQVRALMRYLKIERAHVVGHSSGGNIALQLALDSPQMVHSIVIMEAALPVAQTGSQRLLSTRVGMSQVMENYHAGNKAAAVDGFMRIVAGPTYRSVLDQALPGAFDEAVADAETFFAQELPAVQQWSFKQEDAGRIKQPVLAVIGEKSPGVSPIWSERQRMLLTWLPKAEPFVLADSTHMLHVQNPRGMVEGLVGFFTRHPIKPKI